MTTLAKWNPFRDLETIHNRITTLLRRPLWRTTDDDFFWNNEWAPLADITEDEKEYLIKAELPEVKKEEVKVTVENGTLRITGERKFEKEEEGKKYHRVERAYGAFERTFLLPEDARGDKVTADYKDGVLKVHVPKNEKVTPKAVDVKVD
jgi:HSP20 family protein